MPQSLVIGGALDEFVYTIRMLRGTGQEMMGDDPLCFEQRICTDNFWKYLPS